VWLEWDRAPESGPALPGLPPPAHTAVGVPSPPSHSFTRPAERALVQLHLIVLFRLSSEFRRTAAEARPVRCWHGSR
jgi:hypothetical protein